jgi:epoxyqueuosine reductase
MTTADSSYTPQDLHALTQQIKQWGVELGFQQVGIGDLQLQQDEQRLHDWLAQHYHGEMDYMEKHGRKRSHPDELIPGTLRVISARMDYWPGTARAAKQALQDTQAGYVSRYALGRDYHKLLRARLAQLAERISTAIQPHHYRVFVDTGPVLEKALARNAGLGWIGKHSNLINREAGSWFFLGEILTTLPLPVDTAVDNHCGTCTACMEVCPTQAIVAPYQVDARRCISYLTIELRGSIPVEFRKAMGNRIYGCDDCQLFCPWNKFAKASDEPDFTPRQRLDSSSLIKLFAWSEAEFLTNTAGSAIRRIGYECWLRNIAIALGNAVASTAIVTALTARRQHESALVREHVEWALQQHGG